MNPFSIMQGRLLPRYNNHYQAFPVGYWQAEFHIAAQLGFSSIEFIFDNHLSPNDHPIFNPDLHPDLHTLISQSGVTISSICADYFMTHPPHHAQNLDDLINMGSNLILQAQKFNIKAIIIPCVDASSLRSDGDETKLLHFIQALLPIAKKASLYLCLECDKDPSWVASFIERVSHPHFKLNYDSGNSASLGFNIQEEWEAYGNHVYDIHIKDRPFNGFSCELGSGDVDFQCLASCIARYHAEGPIVMQAARQPDYIDDLNMLIRQKNFIHSLLGSA